MLNKEEVVYAYRMLLGREPENEAVLNHYATELKDWRTLRELFMNSLEFQVAVEKTQGPRPPKQSFNGPPMRVELDLAEEQLGRLFAQTSAQWQHLGETEPHWSVLTNDSYYKEHFSMNKAAFFATGISEVGMFQTSLKRSGVSLADKPVCLELGCGVGRVTMALAPLFQEVIGVDISAAHLQVADACYAEAGISNVHSRHLDNVDGIASLGRFDVLYSRIVLQHNPPPIMLRLLRDLLTQLRPGGLAFIQVPTYKAGYRFLTEDYLRTPNHTSMEMHYLPQDALLSLIYSLGCKVLELREDDSTGISVSAISNNLLIQKLVETS